MRTEKECVVSCRMFLWFTCMMGRTTLGSVAMWDMTKQVWRKHANEHMSQNPYTKAITSAEMEKMCLDLVMRRARFVALDMAVVVLPIETMRIITCTMSTPTHIISNTFFQQEPVCINGRRGIMGTWFPK